jgi:uncharacterized protein YgbK (DUF1537 family)
MPACCLFGAIADDYTGGSDLAGMLCSQGVRTVQLFGLPERALADRLAGEYDAIVLCLKSRSIPADEACSQSLLALGFLESTGARQIQFKYCSTFDSTERGNIGPVAEALMDASGVPFSVAVPALPVNGRTQYLGHLFVNGELLSDSPMRTHPLNPMTDSNLVGHLQAQMRGRAGLIDLAQIRRGPEAIRERMHALEREGIRIALMDATGEEDLASIAEAVADLKLITGGSGLAMHLPNVWRSRGLLRQEGRETNPISAEAGATLILSGSCSEATIGQLRNLEETGCVSIAIDVENLLVDWDTAVDGLAAAAERALQKGGAVVVRSSAPAGMRISTTAESASAIESAFAELARRLVCTRAAKRLIVSGGETSGAVVKALGIHAAEVSGILDPSIPALRTLEEPALSFALKSGNFGSADFFQKTIRWWDRQ